VGLRLLRNVDLIVLAITLPIFIAAGFPIAGWATATGVWVLQRLARAYLTRRAERSDDPRTTVGLMAGSMIARGWLVAGAIFAVGLSDHKAGLAAAVLFLAVFTIQFSVSMILRPFEQEPRR
jgi:hypothetical protein